MSDLDENFRTVTLKDVARRANVSDISVSRVMRNAPNISQSLREKVMEAANELGYTPNRLAGALKTKSSNLVAVIVPSMSNAVFPEVIDGIDSVLSPAGLQPVLGITQYNREREIQIVRDMLAWAPMGLIMAGTDHDPAVVQMLKQQRIPVVQMMDIDGEPLQVAIGMSHINAAREVAKHVVERGYKRIGYIGAWGERPDRSKARRLAFEDELKNLGVLLAASMICDEHSSVLLGKSAMEQFTKNHPELDCVFFANDDLAVGATLHCMGTGIKIPDEMALVGFNGIDVGRALPIQLTSVQTARFEMGRETADALLKLHNGKDIPRIHDLGFKLVVGQST